jgi:hypothetical protein
MTSAPSPSKMVTDAGSEYTSEDAGRGRVQDFVVPSPASVAV